MSNPFTYHYNGPPMHLHPSMGVSSNKSSSSFPLTITFLIIALVLFTSIAVVSTCSIEQFHIEEDIISRKNIANEIYKGRNKIEEKDYKTYTAPKNGTLKLNKGVITQIHHGIKEDSVILISRKNIDGRAGSFLTITEIIPNKKFSISSTDDVGAVEEEDCGEIFFQII